MNYNEELLRKFRTTHGGKVILGDSNTCAVEGLGDIHFRMFDEAIRILKNVKYVPNLTKNLISVGTLDDVGNSNKIENRVMKITKGSMVMIKGEKRNGLHYLIGETVTGEVSLASNSEDANAILWHRRMGHISSKGLNSAEIAELEKAISQTCKKCIEEPRVNDEIGEEERTSTGHNKWGGRPPISYRTKESDEARRRHHVNNCKE
uniref:GAG-pre-integrase domain-containing protein n=1 Tax=Cannabis sativa TaxID=3483 RepID=A0A803NUK4_CANSA